MVVVELSSCGRQTTGNSSHAARAEPGFESQQLPALS